MKGKKSIKTKWCRSELKLQTMVFHTFSKDLATSFSLKDLAAIRKIESVCCESHNVCGVEIYELHNACIMILGRKDRKFAQACT